MTIDHNLKWLNSLFARYTRFTAFHPNMHTFPPFGSLKLQYQSLHLDPAIAVLQIHLNLDVCISIEIK